MPTRKTAETPTTAKKAPAKRARRRTGDTPDPGRSTAATTAMGSARAKRGTAASNGDTPAPRRGRAGRELVIVESPAKARTIQGILGNGYEVTASVGHVRDLPRSK